MASTTKVHGLTIVASVAVHAALASVFSWIALGSFADAPEVVPRQGALALGETGSAPIAIDLPTIGEGILVEQEPVDPTGEPPRIAGGDVVAHLDQDSPGHGGDTHVAATALNVADRDERMRLSPDPLSRLDRDQLQRLRVARVRQSWEDRRSTTHPTELTLVVSGPATLIERRPSSPFEPSRGALQSPRASVRGAETGHPSPSAVREMEQTEQRPGGARMGSLDGTPGTGILRAPTGVDHRASAPIGSARPDVAQAAVAVPASDPARPKDDVDTEQEVATAVRSLVHASTAGGLEGVGQGGNGAGGAPGAGAASGAGSHARPLGVGESELFDYWTSDPHLLPYFRQIHAKIDPLWADAFPKSALLDLKQGTVILEFTVWADGHTVVSWPPVRPSGIDAFDRNCAAAIRRASPLPPIPRALGSRSVRIRAPFVANNPIIK